MKRLTAISAAAVIALCSLPAFAANGDIAGQYYSTDIRTYLNDAEINAINIGGRTLIKVRDMENYSFMVSWEEETHSAYVSSLNVPVTGSYEPTAEDYPVGTALGDYYETDIVTYLDGRSITSYNIEGSMYIPAEDMRDYGYIVDWNETDRTLSVKSPVYAGYEYDLLLSAGTRPQTEEHYSAGAGALMLSYDNQKITGSGDAKYVMFDISCDGTGYNLKMQFNASGGLFFTNAVQELMKSMCYSDRGETLAAPEDLYDTVNANVSVIINGHKSEKIAVRKWGGNNHTDYILEFSDIPLYKAGEIESVIVSVGNTDGMEEYEIETT